MEQEKSPYHVSEHSMSPSGAAATPPPRPTVIPRVFGVIHIIFACLGALLAFFGVVAYVGLEIYIDSSSNSLGQHGEALNAMNTITNFILLDVVIGLFLAVVLLIAGIGLLARRLWAVKLSMYWAVARIITVVGMTLVLLSPAKVLRDAEGHFSADQNVQLQQLAGGVGNAIGMIVACVYPLLTILYLRKQRVVDALRHATK